MSDLQRWELIASLLEHPGWRLVEEHIEADVDRMQDALVHMNPSDTARIARAQAHILALRGVIRYVQGAPDKLLKEAEVH